VPCFVVSRVLLGRLLTALERATELLLGVVRLAVLEILTGFLDVVVGVLVPELRLLTDRLALLRFRSGRSRGARRIRRRVVLLAAEGRVCGRGERESQCHRDQRGDELHGEIPSGKVRFGLDRRTVCPNGCAPASRDALRMSAGVEILPAAARDHAERA